MKITSIPEVARKIIEELDPYMKVADWNRKEYLKAKIRAAVKKMLMKAIDGRARFEIGKLSVSVVTHAEIVYALQEDRFAALLGAPSLATAGTGLGGQGSEDRGAHL